MAPVARLRRRPRWWLAGLLPLALLAAGCQATGMGWIPSAGVPTDKATFGFSFESTSDGTTSTLSGSYHDPNGPTATGVVDVAFKGTGVLRRCDRSDPTCQSAPATTRGGCVGGAPPYESQNPRLPGGGNFSVVLCDLDGNGQATGDGSDFLLIEVLSGPYTGYHNFGNPQGNITVTTPVTTP